MILEEFDTIFRAALAEAKTSLNREGLYQSRVGSINIRLNENGGFTFKWTGTFRPEELEDVSSYESGEDC